MRHLISILTPLALTACAAPQYNEIECSGPPQGPPVNVHYGDSQLKVTPPIFKVKKQNKIKFQLIPDKKPSDPAGVNYSTVTVTIEAKNPTAHPWLKASGNDEDDGDLVVCVPGNAQNGVVEYLVRVDEVGTLDPRVEIED